MDELLIEQRFTYVRLDKYKGDLYLNLLLNTKELLNSITSDEKGKMLQLKLEKKDKMTIFSSVLEYGNEVRVYTGEIIDKKNKIYIVGLINRFENVKEEDKNYEVYDTFNFSKKNILRNTMYQYDKNSYNDQVILYNDEEIKSLKKIALNK